KNTYDAGKDCLYRLYLFATIAGVCVALGGIYAIYKQTEAPPQAASATEKSVLLQEAALRGWVNIEHWEVWMDKRKSTIRIRFHIINPTQLPLTLSLLDLTTNIDYIGAEKSWKESFQLSEVLAPNNPYIADITAALSDEQTTKLVDLNDTTGIPILINGRIEFSDSIPRQWEQVFERAIFFAKGELFALKEYAPVV